MNPLECEKKNSTASKIVLGYYLLILLKSQQDLVTKGSIEAKLAFIIIDKECIGFQSVFHGAIWVYWAYSGNYLLRAIKFMTPYQSN